MYVELEATPWVWRISKTQGKAPQIHTHTGLDAAFESAWLDQNGRLYLATDLGLGLVHTLDMEPAADAVSSGLWPPQEVQSAELPTRFGFVRKPLPAADKA